VAVSHFALSLEKQMFINYLALAVVMYIGLKFARILIWHKENKYVRWIAGICLTVTLVMAWNIVAESRFRFEPWRSYDAPKMEPIVEELGIPEEGIILK
jgi:hypothetical protein